MLLFFLTCTKNKFCTLFLRVHRCTNGSERINKEKNFEFQMLPNSISALCFWGVAVFLCIQNMFKNLINVNIFHVTRLRKLFKIFAYKTHTNYNSFLQI